MIKSVYIHIPFCKTICSYCDFCKMHYYDKWVLEYLNSLEKEIRNNYKNEIIDTIYIGGGTPTCLTLEELEKLFNILKIFKTSNKLEYTIEGNIESIDEAKLRLFKSIGINRLSIGIETFNENYLKILNRNHSIKEVKEKIKLMKEIGFININIDLIYALPNQSLEDVKEDINEFLKLDIPHISTYSLIIEEHTKLYIDKIKNIDEDLDLLMYQEINKTLTNNGYHHYEISNYAKEGFESKHNLTYWNNDEYYGFGLGAGGYVSNVRYTNTRSFSNYISGKYIVEENVLNKKEIMENALILGFRKTKGINIDDFNKKYNTNILNNNIIKELIEKRNLINDGSNIYINPDKLYTSNDILINFID